MFALWVTDPPYMYVTVKLITLPETSLICIYLSQRKVRSLHHQNNMQLTSKQLRLTTSNDTIKLITFILEKVNMIMLKPFQNQWCHFLPKGQRKQEARIWWKMLRGSTASRSHVMIMST